MRQVFFRCFTLVLAALCWVIAAPAAADPLTIKQPGNRVRYGFELEPHLLLATSAPGPAHSDGFGLGVRATIPIVENGFVSTINNSVGISFGADWIRYDGRGPCYAYNAAGRCVGFNDGYWDVTYLWLPVTMQWNFWLSRSWSVFGEPGLAFRYVRYDAIDDTDLSLDPLVFFIGGRWHFSESAALTLRLGFPSASVGVSFLF